MFNFKKIASVLASAVMLSSTIGFAAAVDYPTPYVAGGTADAAVVVGVNAAISDLFAAGDLAENLNARVTTGGGSVGAAVSGDSVLLAKSSDNLNLGDTWGVFTGTIDDTDLGTLLADGTYVADDNDEFDYEQTISLGTPSLTHFRDSEYESKVGLTDETPVLGFKITSSTYVLNYTLDFVEDAESDVVSGDLDDIEGSDLVMMGKTYYVSDLKNGTDANLAGKLTLLDSANIGSVSEGEITTVTVGDTTYNVGIAWIDADEVAYDVNGERIPKTGTLQVGDNPWKLSDGAYLGVRDISKLEVSGEIGSSGFSIGTGKIEMTSGSEIKLNGVAIQGVTSWVFKDAGATAGTAKIQKIVIEWKTDEDEFLTEGLELEMPGLGAVKANMAGFVRPVEEKLTIRADGDDSIELTVPIKDGDVTFNILYANASREFIGLGKSATKRLATTANTSLNFTRKEGSGADFHRYFVATYNISSEAQSYLLRATSITEDTVAGRNETDIQKKIGGGWVTVCEDRKIGDSCDIGDVSLTISTIKRISGGVQSVEINASTNVNFHTIYTTGGLRVMLPYVVPNSSYDADNGQRPGAINFTASSSANDVVLGHGYDRFWLNMYPEDKDDNIAKGVAFNVTIDDTTGSSQKLLVNEVDHAGTGGGNGLEIGADSNNYEAYIIDDTATRIVHHTSDDGDFVEVFYAVGDSESYAEIFIAETAAVVTPGVVTTGGGGQVLVVKDSEVGSVGALNLLVVGGSCINSAAATILGSTSPLCGADFTAETSAGTGQHVIMTVASPWDASKVATLVAGYDAADTQAAVARVMAGVVTDVGTSTVYPVSG